jgi:hypothetical protein
MSVHITGRVADPGYLSRIRIFPSRIQGQKIPDPGSGSASKNTSILTIKTISKLSNKMICHPGSGFFSIPDPGVKKAPDPRYRSATLVTGMSQNSQQV